MKVGLIAMILIGSISTSAICQQRQTLFSVGSRIGYSSNTYLNPYYSEWDRSVKAGYGTVSAIGQTAWFGPQNNFELTGGLVFEPFFQNSESWKGGLGLINYQHKFLPKLSGGIEVGGSHFSSSFSRILLWGQPTLTWLPTPFTQFKIKAGSNYRAYNDFVIDSVATDSRSRVDLYSIEFETWPSFSWRLTAGLYGSLAALPAIQEGFNSVVSAGYVFDSGERITLKLGLEQYQNDQTTTTTPGGGGIGFPPAGGPSGSTETIVETDRMFRIGLEGSVPVGNRISLFANVEGLQFHSSTTGEMVHDFQISGGVRLTIQPSSGNRPGTIEPEWRLMEDRMVVEVRHAGESQLYLVGDFNNWKRPGIPMTHRDGNRYVAELSLETGAYEYKVLAVTDGEENWIEFSDDTYTVDDGFGGENALLLVEE